jgi:hypothetical protein
MLDVRILTEYAEKSTAMLNEARHLSVFSEQNKEGFERRCNVSEMFHIRST